MSRTLAAKIGLPYFAVDQIQWRPNWVRTPEPEYNVSHRELISGERWIIDGFGSWPSIERRFEASDTIIFVDHPLWLHYWWATKRQIKAMFVGRPDGPDGCPMLPVTFRLYRMMWWIHREMRPRLLRTIAEHRHSKRVIHIRSPRELASFLENPV